MMNKQITEMHEPLISHVSIGVSDIQRSVKFYDKVMLTLGCEKLVGYDAGAAYGRDGIPSFWVQTPINGLPATIGNGSHVCFSSDSTEMVDMFHAVALAEGGENDGEPGYRERFSKAYYAAFVRDKDGHKIEAMFWDVSKL
jgi:catechol 2,3-dioxygenase-like lactoylglutathione lyase family enzyme